MPSLPIQRTHHSSTPLVDDVSAKNTIAFNARFWVREQLARLCRSVARHDERPAFRRAMRQKLPNLVLAHLIRMPLLVKQDEPPTPTDLRFFRRQGVVPTPQDIAKLIEKFGFHRRICGHGHRSIGSSTTAPMPDIADMIQQKTSPCKGKFFLTPPISPANMPENSPAVMRENYMFGGGGLARWSRRPSKRCCR